ncbi:MAG: alpha/beta hydrolase [Micavibrio sp.]|nr:alpha/beta hydrolase [Micavibrio sp.]|tara:strand:+ start:3399 stop:4178 length:780 start_codon:yes stop_codon:yes gene_type:complete
MECQFLKRSGKNDIAYHYSAPVGEGKDLPHVFFLGGFKSDMNGTKATYLEAQCKARGQGFLRFDYTGHGQSGGDFVDGTIGSWKGDALDIFDHIAADKVILVGSSMGGWISLLVAREREKFLHGIIGIAAAPDFTIDMWFNRLNESQRQEIEEKGRAELPNDYDEPYILTKALFEDGKQHLLLDAEQDIDVPMVLIQGMADPDVPWEVTARIEKAFPKSEVDIVLIEDGDHRLSRPEDLALLDKEVTNLSHRNNQYSSL